MTLHELAPSYRAEAERLSAHLRVLRRACRTASGDKEFMLRRRIAQMTEMLTQMHELAELTDHYYERSYQRNAKYRL